MDISRRFWRLLCMFLLILWRSRMIVEAGINSTHLHMGRDITRIATIDFQDIYIGGVNFIAQLTPKLFIKFNVTIGPVTTSEHCSPNPAPCDNIVRILEIDPVHKMLLVCGSAYQGTCTLHSLQNIDVWFCLNGDANNDGAGVVSGSHERNSVVHFLPSTPDNSSKVPVVSSRECRPKEFGQKYFVSNDSNPVYVRMQHSVPRTRFRRSLYSTKAVSPRETREVGIKFQDFDGIFNKSIAGLHNSKNPVQSNVMIAGSVYNPKMSINPLHLSIRSIIFNGSHYTISYSRGQDSSPVGFQMKNVQDISVSPDYKLSFTWDNYSYFVFLQQSTDCEKAGRCIQTKMSRTCHDPSSLLPYVEINLMCTDKGKKYRLLNSAVLGTVGLVHSASYATVPVLVMAFGNNSDPASSAVDPTHGTAVCAVTLDELNKSWFNYALDTCAIGDLGYIARHASWITGTVQHCFREPTQSGVCTSNTKNKYVQNMDVKEMYALTHFKELSVINVLTQTHVVSVDTQGRSSLNEVMDVFLLTNVGFLKKVSLRAALRGQAFSVEVETPVMDFSNLTDAVTSRSVGITDHVRAVVYLTAGPKIIEFGLEFCLQLRNCAECRVHVEECRWCPVENKCRDRKLTSKVCTRTVDVRCPPILSEFDPAKVPTQGGSMLTMKGFHLGVHNEGLISVTMCGQSCDNITASESRISCKVKSRCASCADKCHIEISVSHRTSEGDTSSSLLPDRQWLEYLDPIVTSFSPNFGPSRGGTVVRFQGQNLKIGSSTIITVGGALCDVQPDSDLICRIQEDDQRRPSFADIVISIDNFRTTLRKRFEFRESPTVQNLSPLKTIESGGVSVAVTGFHLDSADSSVLMITVPITSGGDNANCTSEFSQKCNTPINNRKMVCKTPAVSSCFRNNLTVQVAVYMDGRDMLTLYPHLQQMTVHPNPVINESFIDTASRSLIIRGNNIPDWIHRSDITASFANVTLNLTEVKSNYIKFDMRSWNLKQFQTKQSSNQLVFTRQKGNFTQLDESNVTDAIDYSDLPKSNGAIISETTSWKSTRDPDRPFNIVMENPVPTSKLGTVDKINTSTTTASTIKYSVTRSDENRTFSTVPLPPVDGSTGNGVIQKTVKIKVTIGNYYKELDFVFYTDDNRTSTTAAVGPVKNSKLNIALFAGAGGAGVLLLLLVIVSSVLYIRAKKAQALVKEQAFYMSSLSGSQHGSKEGALPSLKQILQSVIEPDQRADMDKLIISLDCLSVGKKIGSGNFGCVFEAYLALNKETPAEKVAVKTLQDPSSHTIDLHAFVKEAVLMREFQHPHVLGLIGLAEKEPGIPYVILPYMDNGDLSSFVRDSSVSLSLHDVIKFGADIASGMAYLSTLKFVHRDLAARNCMLDDQYRVKVADFGLCRDIYEKGYYTSDNRKKLPIRWMAVESIEHGAYSSKSDVWSLGVVLWELLSRGVTPYPGVNGWDVINFLRHRRLAPPYFCPDALYDLMMQCWAKEPNLRPDFITVQTTLLNMIGQSPTITDTMKRRRGDTLLTSGSKNDSHSEKHSSSKKDNPKPEKVPRKTLQTAAPKQRNKNPQVIEKDTVANVVDSDRKDMPYMNIGFSSSIVVKNILITIPTCYSHRDVSKTAAGTYIQLVDNYEPPPKFSNPLLRSMKKLSKKSHDSLPKNSPKNHDSAAEVSGYSVPVEYLPTRNSLGDIVNDDLVVSSRNSEASINNTINKASNYYELENTSMRTSAGSDSHSAWSTLCISGSQASILEGQNQGSSLNISRSSATSAQSAPYSNLPHLSANRAVGNKQSPLAERTGSSEKRIPKQRVIKQDGGRAKSADVLTYL